MIARSYWGQRGLGNALNQDLRLSDSQWFPCQHSSVVPLDTATPGDSHACAGGGQRIMLARELSGEVKGSQRIMLTTGLFSMNPEPQQF